MCVISADLCNVKLPKNVMQSDLKPPLLAPGAKMSLGTPLMGFVLIYFLYSKTSSTVNTAIGPHFIPVWTFKLTHHSEEQV